MLKTSLKQEVTRHNRAKGDATLLLSAFFLLFPWSGKRKAETLGKRLTQLFWINQAPVVQKVDNVIHRINHYPLDIAIGFAITYPVDSDLSGG